MPVGLHHHTELFNSSAVLQATDSHCQHEVQPKKVAPHPLTKTCFRVSYRLRLSGAAQAQR